jgi:hypothetical protein
MEIKFESTVIEIRFKIIILIFIVQPLKCYDSLTARALLNLNAPCGRVFSVFSVKDIPLMGKFVLFVH